MLKVNWCSLGKQLLLLKSEMLVLVSQLTKPGEIEMFWKGC
jgi:hypothetical protein